MTKEEAKEEAKQRIAALSEELEQHNYNYYILAKPYVGNLVVRYRPSKKANIDSVPLCPAAAVRAPLSVPSALPWVIWWGN